MNQDIDLQENRIIYEKLQENKEIVESCNEKIAILNEAIQNLNKAIQMNKEKDELNQQIEKLENQIETQERVNKLFDGENKQANKSLIENKEKLTNLKASLILSQTTLEAYNRKKEELISKEKELIGKKQDALDMIENIAEIYDEKAEKLEKRIEDKLTNKNEKNEKLETLIPKYSTLEKRLKKLNSFGDLISDKKMKEKKEIEAEMDNIREAFISLMPNFNKKLIESLKIETEFEVDKRRSTMEIQRQETRMKTYQKLSKEAIDFLKTNDYIFDNQIKIYDRSDEKKKESESKEEQSKDKLYAPLPQWEIKKEVIDISKPVQDLTYTLKANINNSKSTENKWNKNENDELEFFFGNQENYENNQHKQSMIEIQTDNIGTLKMESNEMMNENESNKYKIDLFEEINNTNNQIAEEKQIKNSYENNPKYSNFYEALKTNSKKESIGSKVKKRIEKEKKEKLFARFKHKIFEYFTKPIEEENIEENDMEKGGRIK